MVYYNFIAVKKGRNPGIYLNWSEVKPQIEGFEGAEYKFFQSYTKCQEYIDDCKYPWGFPTEIGSLARNIGVKFMKPGCMYDMEQGFYQHPSDRDPPNPEKLRAKLLEHMEKMSKAKQKNPHTKNSSMKDMKKFFVDPKK